MIIIMLISSIFIFITGQFFVSRKLICSDLRYLIFNIISIINIILILSLFLNIKTAIVATTILFLLLGFSFFYVHEFRGTNFNFQDLMSIGTAKEVAGGYSFEIKPRFIIIIALDIAFIYALYRYSQEFYLSLVEKSLLAYNILSHKIIFFLLFALNIFILFRFLYKRHYNYSINAGEIEGYIFNFISSMPIFYIYENYFKHEERFDVYTDVSYTQFFDNYVDNKIKYNARLMTKIKSNFDFPNVICIMNESFGSLQEYIKTKEKVTPYFDNLNAFKGHMYVNTIGGGTSNTEYDFLRYSVTGDSNMPIYPFNNLVKEDTYALPRYFKSLGYSTLAFHPYTRTNYNRDKVYKYFGFDKFIADDNMMLSKSKRKYIRNYLSDESMYEEVIGRYKEAVKGNNKLFLYGVTIQNHGGYDTLDHKNIHISKPSPANIKNIKSDIKDKKQVENYLTLMKHSDDAIHVLIDFFKNRNEHVIILFFGDHNASFGKGTNNQVFTVPKDYQFSNAYRVPFFIYDNKRNLKSIKNYETSPNFLAKTLIELAKMPYDYDMRFMAELEKYEKMENYGKKILDKKVSSNRNPYNNAENIIFQYEMLQKLFMIKGYNNLV